MNLLIDMDGVICTEEKTFERALAKPIPGAREAIALLREQGHQVIIYTSRSWSELAMTKNWLSENRIEVDGIHMGKPIADRIIDDRAIHFNGWPAALETVGKDLKPDIDQVYLKILREATQSFLREICENRNLQGPVLEVGPMTREGLNSSIYQTMPETFFDMRTEVLKKGLKYISLDIDPSASPDICCDFMLIKDHIEKNSIGTIVLMSCLEHMPRVFDVPKLIHEVLRPDGLVFILTPWNRRFHGPRPDCWRISDDGYRALFSDLFNILRLDKIDCPGRPLSPVGLIGVFQKK